MGHFRCKIATQLILYTNTHNTSIYHILPKKSFINFVKLVFAVNWGVSPIGLMSCIFIEGINSKYCIVCVVIILQYMWDGWNALLHNSWCWHVPVMLIRWALHQVCTTNWLVLKETDTLLACCIQNHTI